MNNSYPDKDEERRLVSLALKGDNSAFGLIIKNTEKLVAQIVFKMIANNEDRKDIAQDIYLKAWNRLPGFRFECKLSTWIAQISYNTSLDHLRKKKMVLTGNEFDIIEPENETALSFDKPNHTYYPAENDSITGKELSVILKEEIERLPPIYKTMIALYHQQELSYEEIGEVTGLPAGTVKSYLFRARRVLRNNLAINYKKEDL